MNVLLTSAGRRSYLVKYFQQALESGGMVHASNSEPSMALEVADRALITPLIYDNNYTDFLLAYCLKNEITVVISLFDIDLPVLAKAKEQFRRKGIHVIVSDYEVTQICNDKWRTIQFLKETGILAPQSYLHLTDAKKALRLLEIGFPLMVKPRWGMGSLSLFKADNEVELEVFYEKVRREVHDSYLRYESSMDPDRAVIIQEFLNGQEYGLDVVNDLNKKYLTTFVKMKTGMRSGETDGAITVKDPLLEETGERIGKSLGHIANLDIDCILMDGKPYILEMNCRFGGGYPFTHLAGANLPKAILNWVNNQDGNACLEAYKTDVRGGKDIQPAVLRKIYDS